jgi:hypothetical protein
MIAEGPGASQPCTRHAPLDERATYFDALAAALEKQGLQVSQVSQSVLLAANPAASADDPRGQAISPGLNQQVTCLRYHDGLNRWWWFWTWPHPTDDSLPDLEPLCPAESTETAAQAIARVLAVPSNNPGTS